MKDSEGSVRAALAGSGSASSLAGALRLADSSCSPALPNRPSGQLASSLSCRSRRALRPFSPGGAFLAESLGRLDFPLLELGQFLVEIQMVQVHFCR